MTITTVDEFMSHALSAIELMALGQRMFLMMLRSTRFRGLGATCGGNGAGCCLHPRSRMKGSRRSSRTCLLEFGRAGARSKRPAWALRDAGL
jgi:hypothetical protein